MSARRESPRQIVAAVDHGGGEGAVIDDGARAGGKGGKGGARRPRPFGR